MQNFLGGVDEDWFIMIHVAIEYEAKEILSNLKSYFLEKNLDQSYLQKALDSIRKINSIMNRMPEKCDPFIYYNRVRPYIFGWKNNPATPDGVIYEGVDEYNGKPQLFRGETGAQSSIVPALDALLGVTHSNDPLREYLDEMRLYMPKEHRELLNGLDEWSKNERTKLNINEESVEIINELIKEVHTLAPPSTNKRFTPILEIIFRISFMLSSPLVVLALSILTPLKRVLSFFEIFPIFLLVNI